MKVLIVHNRYRLAAPSGENAVVDQESSALMARGHEVALFQRTQRGNRLVVAAAACYAPQPASCGAKAPGARSLSHWSNSRPMSSTSTTFFRW